jgi:uncharacterized protein
MMRVAVVVALSRRQEVIAVELPEGSTVADAIRAADVRGRFPEIDPAAMRTGIWSRPCEPAAAVRDGDRVELYRPLAADPKEARRARARRKR